MGNNDAVLWQSQSALGLELPAGSRPQPGKLVFAREALPDGTPLLTLSLAVQWEFPGGELKPYIFKVSESLDSFNAQIAKFRRQLFSWFAAVALIMLLAISLLMRSLLRPLRQIESEIGAIEEGSRVSLSEDFPTELTGVARNMNLLIGSERARSDRYRKTLDNLAHSLKTPLAAVRTLINDSGDRGFSDRVNEQVDRMDEIVRYQLRKPASSTDNLVLTLVPVADEIGRLVAGLKKVYREKAPQIETHVAPDVRFRGDTGDFLELAGNLIDNACKWCRKKVRVTVTPVEDKKGGLLMTVEDDGPGIPDGAADALMQRGTRLDESTPGHGIGLAIVKDIASAAGGTLTIGSSGLGGACVVVTIPPANA